MKRMISAQYISLLALVFSIAASSVNAEPIDTDRFGLYVVVDDLDRASAFYEQLFGVPEIQMPSLVGFEVAGGLYAVVSRETYAADAIRGDTMRAYINVDIQKLFSDCVKEDRSDSPAGELLSSPEAGELSVTTLFGFWGQGRS
jgi:hypothetical protein